MSIILDAMGSDDYPDPEIQAAVIAARQYGEEIILVGNEEVIMPKLKAANVSSLPIKVVHAPEVIEMGDKPAENLRRKSQNSMAIGMEQIKSRGEDAFITAGNTGAAMMNALKQLGRMKGVRRPALTALFPVKDGHCVVLDICANAECKP